MPGPEPKDQPLSRQIGVLNAAGTLTSGTQGCFPGARESGHCPNLFALKLERGI